ncbi:MAG: hypothetical protein HY905_17530 [Deltaproteobacteria bacterium]|nr:hypothetical protein [Deltaproteobacteria bacterium]
MDRRLLGTLVAATLTMLAASVASAQPTGPLFGPTEIRFRAEGGEPLAISLYDATVDDGTYVPLCTTPCAIQLPYGNHELMAGGHQTFTVAAAGGVQEWLVEDKSIGGIVAGAVLTGVGPGLPLLAMLFRGFAYLFTIWGCGSADTDAQCEFFNDDMDVAMIVTGAVGGAMLIAGIATLTTSFGTAEQVPASAGTLALGPRLRLAPGLFAYENPEGSHNLGLNLALRF